MENPFNNKTYTIIMSRLMFIVHLLLFSGYIFSNKNCDYKQLSIEYLVSLTTKEGQFVDVVVPINQREIAVVNITLLLQTYNLNYRSHYKTENDFLIALYSERINDIGSFFEDSKVEINNSIMIKYHCNGLKSIIDEYLIYDEYNSYKFKRNNINWTVVLIMFLNNYYLYYDDYTPNYSFQLNFEKMQQENYENIQ